MTDIIFTMEGDAVLHDGFIREGLERLRYRTTVSRHMAVPDKFVFKLTAIPNQLLARLNVIERRCAVMP